MILSVGGTPITYGGKRLQLPLPRITMSGKNLIRNGERFGVFGVAPSHLEWEIAYFKTGGATERTDIISHILGAKKCGANAIRTKLNLWDFISGTSVNDLAVTALAMTNFLHLLTIARQYGIYALVSGNNTKLLDVVPAWYDLLSYEDRWDVQSFFFEELAAAVLAAGHSTTVLGYELMSEPAINSSPTADWYIGSSGSYYFAQNIARGVLSANQPQVTRDWITQLSGAIRGADPKAKITIGLLPQGGASFGPENLDDVLDFLSPHIYPPFNGQDGIDDVLAQVDNWANSALPVIVGESIGWGSDEDNIALLEAMLPPAMQGYLAFYYGYPPSQYTTYPVVPRPPAEEDLNPFVYLINQYSLAQAMTYRAEFLAP